MIEKPIYVLKMDYVTDIDGKNEKDIYGLYQHLCFSNEEALKNYFTNIGWEFNKHMARKKESDRIIYAYISELTLCE